MGGNQGKLCLKITPWREEEGDNENKMIEKHCF